MGYFTSYTTWVESPLGIRTRVVHYSHHVHRAPQLTGSGTPVLEEILSQPHVGQACGTRDEHVERACGATMYTRIHPCIHRRPYASM